VVNHASEYAYTHVINTLPLSVTTVLDTSSLPDLPYNSTMAWRSLTYDSAGKIGMSFRTRWWEDPAVLSTPIIGGQSFTDRPMRRCVYPSYGLNLSNAPGAMIGSYTWSQDSDRLGAFYQSADQQAFITHAILQDLARLHNLSIAFLQDQLMETHFWDFNNQPFSAGGYALFGPGQFSNVLPPLLRPNCHGRLHTAGEATSSGHAWIVGAMNSAYRTVMEVLAVENRPDLMEDVIQMWGVVDEVDMGWFITLNDTIPNQ
jgi:monoamine oxidase